VFPRSPLFFDPAPLETGTGNQIQNFRAPENKEESICNMSLDVDELFEAAASGNFEVVKRLLDEGNVDPNSLKLINNFQTTPLDEAASYGHLEVVKLLLSDKRIIADVYAIRWAAFKNHADIVKLFLEDGRADPVLEGLYTYCSGNCTLGWASQNLENTEAAIVLLNDKRVWDMPFYEEMVPMINKIWDSCMDPASMALTMIKASHFISKLGILELGVKVAALTFGGGMVKIGGQISAEQIEVLLVELSRSSYKKKETSQVLPVKK